VHGKALSCKWNHIGKQTCTSNVYPVESGYGRIYEEHTGVKGVIIDSSVTLPYHYHYYYHSCCCLDPNGGLERLRFQDAFTNTVPGHPMPVAPISFPTIEYAVRTPSFQSKSFTLIHSSPKPIFKPRPRTIPPQCQHVKACPC
jgi:hypothetical protein